MNRSHPGPRFPTLVRLAVTGGRADTLRIVLTVLGTAACTLVLLLVAAVASIGPTDGPYRLAVLAEPGLRPGVVVALLLLCVPILVLVAQCTRVGAPARDRRLATMRMAGGTPADVRRIVALESGVAALGGALVGGAAYLVLHVSSSGSARGDAGAATGFADRSAGAHLLPTDVAPKVWLVVLALALVPVAATLGGMLALRRVTISPFGVVHVRERRPPTVIPAVMFLIGAVGLAAWELVVRWLHLGERQSLAPAAGLVLILFTLTGVGLIFGSASWAYALGRLIAPRTSRPVLLVAARRMVAAPFTASRASTAVVLAVLLGAAVQGTRSNFLAQTDPNDAFYRDTFELLDLVLMAGIGVAAAGLLIVAAEGIVARRRTLASLVAAGTPRRTLAGATLLETLLPLAPTVVLATAAGLFAARGFFGTTVDGSMSRPEPVGDPSAGHLVPVPVPWLELVTLAGGALLVVALVTAAATALIRRSTSPRELRAA